MGCKGKNIKKCPTYDGRTFVVSCCIESNLFVRLFVLKQIKTLLMLVRVLRPLGR